MSCVISDYKNSSPLLPPPLISLSPLFTGLQSYCPFSCLPKQQPDCCLRAFAPAVSSAWITLPVAFLHGHPILISQVLSKMSFLQKLSLTTLTHIPLLSFTQYIFLVYFLLYLLTYYTLLHRIKDTLLERKNT